MTFFVNTWRISNLGRAGQCVCDYAMKVGQALGPLCEPVCCLEERKKGGKKTKHDIEVTNQTSCSLLITQ